MSDLHRFSTTDLYRSAKGAKGKQLPRGHRAHEGPVTVVADLHVEITQDTEADARRFLLAIEAAVLKGGGSVTVSNGPTVKPVGPRRPRLKR